jgi:hypothetical protein
VDCEAHVFRCLLRLLQGYTLPVPEELKSACRLEAHRLGLREAWEMRYPPSPQYAFIGGGTSEQQRAFTSYVVLSRVGPWLPVHPAALKEPADKCTFTVTIRVELCDFVSVGVISHHVVDFGADCKGVRGTAMYNANGDVHCTPLIPPQASQGAAAQSDCPTTVGRAAPFASEAIITVTLDVARGIVLWDRAGHHTAVGLLWEYPASNATALRTALGDASLAFAVVCSGKSAVRIVQ